MSQLFWTSVGARSCWLEIQGPSGQLYNIHVGLGRLGLISICHCFINVLSMGILEAVAMLRVLFMILMCLLMKPLD